MSELNINNISNITNTHGNINFGVIENNLYHSADWQKMQAQHDELLQRIKDYPDVAVFKKDLDDLTKQMDDFKRDVLKLAEEFQRISIDTERLKLAHDHFQKGEFREARAILDTKKMGNEQDQLLQRKQTINTELDTINEQLAHNATEFLIAARLTAIDYDLKEARIPESREYFERALQANRSPEYLFEYAKFLQENNQFQDAEQYYREVLAIYESLAEQQPNVYLPYVATTQNNLAVLLSEDPQQRQLAQQYYEQALAIRQQFAEQQPNVYLPDVANTQNNLANLLSEDPQQRQLAQQYYEQALDTYLQLAEQQPNVYLPDVANTQNNLANLLSDDPQQRQLAQQYYEQALDTYQQLAEQQPNVYLSDVAIIQNNLANLLSEDPQQRQLAQQYYESALITWRNLVENYGNQYRENLVRTLYGLSNAYLQWGEPNQALPLLQEAAEQLQPLLVIAPEIYGEWDTAIQDLLQESMDMIGDKP